MPIVRAGCAALIACLGASPISAQARYFQLIDGRDGLTTSVVTALAQDRSGLLWIGTAGGLFRYDGTRVQQWASDRLDTWVATITVSPAGEVIVVDEKEGALLRIEASGVSDVSGPHGDIRGAGMAVFDRTGGLWVSQGAGLIRRDAESGQWQRTPLDSVDGTLPRILVALMGADILAATRKAVWRVRPGRPPERLADFPDVINARLLPDGRLLGLTFNAALVEFGDSVTRSAPVGFGRGIDLAERNGTLWVSLDRSLVAIGPDDVKETLAAGEGISGSGPLLVDHEGSLWMGSWNGLFRFPEPDTRIWGASQGLPSDHVRLVAHAPAGFLINTWQGPGFIRRVAGRWTATPIGSTANGYRHHIDREGRVWSGSVDGIVHYEGDRVTVASAGPAYLRSMVEDPAGRIHAATHRGLFTADSRDALRRVKGLPFSSDSASLDLVFVDRAGRVWIAGEGRVCVRMPAGEPPPMAVATHPVDVDRALDVASAPAHADDDERTRSRRWQCSNLPAAVPVTALVETASGALWMALERRGVFVLRDGRWEPIPGTRALPTVHVGNLVPSLAGGFWLVGPGMVLRVVEDTAHLDGWRVEERLTGWHGLPQSAASDVFEEPDGTLWIATMLGVVRVPAEVRRARPAPPRVLLVDGFVDEEHIPLDRSLSLPFRRNRLRLRFAAVSFRDPSLLRYQVRATPEHAWETIAGTPEFRWVDLETGRYRAEMRASLDGEHWSADPARFEFQVHAPWYRTYWALTLFAAILMAIAVFLHRARVAVHVELERQRMRIAMDLHDELGSGLGSIGILAGVLRSAPPDDGAAGTRQVAGEIGSTAAALGTALSDIVWALDRRSGSLDSVASRLTEHGNRLFPNGGARFITRFPTLWPAAKLDLAARRNILLIGVEALHNAARHAGASSVALHFETGPAGWTLEVRDDGIGLPPDASQRGGMGLASMRLRAHQIGAQLHWLTNGPAGGTTVQLCIPTRDRRPSYFPWRNPQIRRRPRRPA